MARSFSSGTRTAKEKAPVLSGTRRRVYQHDEHWAMINIDRFDRLEAVIKNRSRFSHLGAMLLAGGVPLGVEMGVQAYFESDPVSVGLLIVCAAAVAFGLLFFFLAWLEGKSYTAVKDSLFSQDKLLSDETITHYEDGSTTRVVHPVTVSSRSCKTQIKVHRKAI